MPGYVNSTTEDEEAVEACFNVGISTTTEASVYMTGHVIYMMGLHNRLGLHDKQVARKIYSYDCG